MHMREQYLPTLCRKELRNRKEDCSFSVKQKIEKKKNEWNNMRDYLKINITFHITVLSDI